MYLKIVNDGEMDINALFLMGATNKEGNNSKIGFFGSGNKYAMTTLLRKGVDLQIFRGTTRVVLSLADVQFRGQTSQQIWIDGMPTSFTTRMGPEWEEWMSLREFICNAKDEGGYELSVEEDVLGGIEGKTSIYVEMNDSIKAFHESITEFIVDDTVEVLDSVDGAQIMPTETFAVYRKGIRCSIQTEQKAHFAYDFDQISINESRVFDRDWEMRRSATNALQQTTSREVVKKILEHCKDEEYFEHNLYWDSGEYSKPWKEELDVGLFIFNESSLQFLPAGEAIGQIVLPDNMFNGIRKSFPGLKWYGNINQDFFVVSGTDEQNSQIKAADAEVRGFGYKQVQISVVKFFHEDLIARVRDGKIYLSQDHLDDYDELCSTLLEEHEHIDNGFRDGTRSFEQYLCKQLVLARRKAKMFDELQTQSVDAPALEAKVRHQQLVLDVIKGAMDLL